MYNRRTFRPAPVWGYGLSHSTEESNKTSDAGMLIKTDDKVSLDHQLDCKETNITIDNSKNDNTLFQEEKIVNGKSDFSAEEKCERKINNTRNTDYARSFGLLPFTTITLVLVVLVIIILLGSYR